VRRIVESVVLRPLPSSWTVSRRHSQTLGLRLCACLPTADLSRFRAQISFGGETSPALGPQACFELPLPPETIRAAR